MHSFSSLHSCRAFLFLFKWICSVGGWIILLTAPQSAWLILHNVHQAISCINCHLYDDVDDDIDDDNNDEGGDYDDDDDVDEDDDDDDDGGGCRCGGYGGCGGLCRGFVEQANQVLMNPNEKCSI